MYILWYNINEKGKIEIVRKSLLKVSFISILATVSRGNVLGTVFLGGGQ